jgi:hypothetical protein
MSVSRAFHGVIPAMAIPFRDDYKIDEAEEVAAMRVVLEASGVPRVELV